MQGFPFGTACDLKKHETKKAGIFPDGKKKEDEEMRYEIKGDTLPVVICYLDGGEQMITERGSMSWMSPNMKMETTSNGGIGKALGRMFAGEALFQNRYTAEGGNGLIAFASSFPGRSWQGRSVREMSSSYRSPDSLQRNREWNCQCSSRKSWEPGSSEEKDLSCSGCPGREWPFWSLTDMWWNMSFSGAADRCGYGISCRNGELMQYGDQERSGNQEHGIRR